MTEHPFRPGQKVVAREDIQHHSDYNPLFRKALAGVLTVRHAYGVVDSPCVTFDECPPCVDSGGGPDDYWRFLVLDRAGNSWFRLHGIASKKDMEALYG